MHDWGDGGWGDKETRGRGDKEIRGRGDWLSLANDLDLKSFLFSTCEVFLFIYGERNNEKLKKQMNVLNCKFNRVCSKRNCKFRLA